MTVATPVNTHASSAEASSLDFRQIMKAISYPGSICHCLSFFDSEEIEGLQASAQQIANTLISSDVSVAFVGLKPSEVHDDWLRLGLRAKQVPVEKADYIFIAANNLQDLDLSLIKIGSAESPEKSATLLISLQNDFHEAVQRPLTLSGPGINPDEAAPVINLDSMPSSFLEQRALICQEFPQGVDLFCCTEKEFLAIPRTTVIRWAGE